MPLVKICPSCNERMLPLGHERLSRERLWSAIRKPRVVKCPHCGTAYKASRGYWYMAHIGGLVTGIGALGLLGLTVDLISPTYTLGAFVVTGFGIGIMYFGLWRIRLEKVGE